MPKKTIYQYDLLGNYIQEFSCAKEVENIYGYKAEKIRKKCARNQLMGDFYWSYKKVHNIFEEEL
jgi:hypothetical protein